MGNKIGIIDYGFGNVRSVENALNYIGYNDVEIFDDSDKVKLFDKLILPGVGAFEDAIFNLKKQNFDTAIKEHIDKEKYLLGICLGMQLLFDKSYENGIHHGLSLLKGNIVKLDIKEKVPHMGWNSLNIQNGFTMYKDILDNSYMYFDHSYYLETGENFVSATTFYGKELQVSVEKKNIFAVQYHPEKSGDEGLKLLKTFCKR